MDFSWLEKLGKVGGIAGIALGVFVLVAGAVINASGTVPDAWRGPIFVALIVGAVVLAALALVLWAGGRPGAQVATAEGDDSAILIKDKGKGGGSQSGNTKGKNSPVTIERG